MYSICVCDAESHPKRSGAFCFKLATHEQLVRCLLMGPKQRIFPSSEPWPSFSIGGAMETDVTEWVWSRMPRGGLWYVTFRTAMASPRFRCLIELPDAAWLDLYGTTFSWSRAQKLAGKSCRHNLGYNFCNRFCHNFTISNISIYVFRSFHVRLFCDW